MCTILHSGLFQGTVRAQSDLSSGKGYFLRCFAALETKDKHWDVNRKWPPNPSIRMDSGWLRVARGGRTCRTPWRGPSHQSRVFEHRDTYGQAQVCSGGHQGSSAVLARGAVRRSFVGMLTTCLDSSGSLRYHVLVVVVWYKNFVLALMTPSIAHVLLVSILQILYESTLEFETQPWSDH